MDRVSRLVPVGVLAIATLVGCGAPPAGGGGTATAATTTARRELSSGMAVERYFPLRDGYIYQYVTEDEAGSQGVLTARVSRPAETHGALRLGGDDKRFEYLADGVKLLSSAAMTGPAYVLKLPIAVGTSWRGEHGGEVRITAVDKVVTVPAGQYAGCVETIEQRGGDMPVRYATTFCPDLGIVQLEAATANRSERATLKSYGPPVDIGPAGLFRVE